MQDGRLTPSVLFRTGSPFSSCDAENAVDMLLEKRSPAISVCESQTNTSTARTSKSFVLKTAEGVKPFPCDLNACKRGLISAMEAAFSVNLFDHIVIQRNSHRHSTYVALLVEMRRKVGGRSLDVEMRAGGKSDQLL